MGFRNDTYSDILEHILLKQISIALGVNIFHTSMSLICLPKCLAVAFPLSKSRVVAEKMVASRATYCRLWQTPAPLHEC